MARKAKLDWREQGIYWMLIAFLVLVFLTGGASRGDAMSLIMLRPAAVLVCGVALYTLTSEQVRTHRFLFAMAGAIFALVLSHLIPLPPFIWGQLPGRELVADIDKAAGLGAVWRPLTMVPYGGWNALYSLFVPMAVLLAGVQLTRVQLFQLLPWLIGFGVLSGCVGILQVIGDPKGTLYLYRVTVPGAAVGLFSNRNHQAMLLATLFPLLAAYASTSTRSEEQNKFRNGLTLATGAVLVPLLLVTGSRAGLITGVLGLASVAFVYRRPSISGPKRRKAKVFDPRIAIAAFSAILLGALTVVMSRAEALKRLSAADQTEELRFQMWGPIADMAGSYFPFGSGAGSFVEVFQIHEPYALLKPSYVNHAHNDWLEVYMTAGLPGLTLLAIAVAGFAICVFDQWRDRNDYGKGALMGRAGAVIIMIFALGSVGDYPLRTPSLSAVFVIACLWMVSARTASPSAGEKIAGS